MRTLQAMLRVTQDVVELRGWVQSHGGWPVRRVDGSIAIGFGGETRRGVDIGWDEFEPNFCAGRWVFVYDYAPGSRRCFLGNAEEARRFVERG